MKALKIAVLVLFAWTSMLFVTSCDEDDDNSDTGICFYECDGMTAEIGGVTMTQCEDELDEDCPDGFKNFEFVAGCEECADCEPDWYECWD